MGKKLQVVTIKIDQVENIARLKDKEEQRAFIEKRYKLKQKQISKQNRHKHSISTAEQFTRINAHQHFSCSICLSTLIFPVRLQCGHQNILFNLKCAICRMELSFQNQYQVSLSMTQLVETYVAVCLSQEEQGVYRERKEQFLKKDEERVFTFPFKEQDRLDYWDKEEGRWRKGQIANIFTDRKPKQNIIIFVQPEDRSDQDEKEVKLTPFHIKSRKIAKYEYFSGKPSKKDQQQISQSQQSGQNQVTENQQQNEDQNDEENWVDYEQISSHGEPDTNYMQFQQMHFQRVSENRESSSQNQQQINDE